MTPGTTDPLEWPIDAQEVFFDLSGRITKLEKERNELAKLCRQAFVDGAKWWEFIKTDATMWQSDQNAAHAEFMENEKYRTVIDILNEEERHDK